MLSAQCAGGAIPHCRCSSAGSRGCGSPARRPSRRRRARWGPGSRSRVPGASRGRAAGTAAPAAALLGTPATPGDLRREPEEEGVRGW